MQLSAQSSHDVGEPRNQRRRIAAKIIARAKLHGVIAPPRPQAAEAVDGQAVPITRADGNDVVETGNPLGSHRGIGGAVAKLSAVVSAPGPNVSIGGKSETMGASGGDAGDVGEDGKALGESGVVGVSEAELPRLIGAPAPNRLVGTNDERVMMIDGNSGGTRRPGTGDDRAREDSKCRQPQ